MSAILVVLDLRGDPVDEALFDSMLRSIDERGRDGSGKWVGGPIGLGHQSTALTPEEVGETQPVQLGSLAGVFEGRLDDRDELLAEFAPISRGAPTLTDAELCVHAYHEWGSACTSHLIGEFGFAIWDDERQALFCARDPLGVRPMYYWQGARSLVVSTDLRAVLAHPDSPREPNPAAVADHLMWRSTSRTETLYRSIYRLEPARTLRVERGRVEIERYWNLTRNEIAECVDDAEWVERLEDVLSTALRCRLRAVDTPTIALSGGLDSSLLAALAIQAARSGSAVSPDVVTATSLVFPGLDCDEQPFIRYVTERLAISSRPLQWRPISWDATQAQARRLLYLPPYPNTTCDMFVRAGFRDQVVITGFGGDQWMNGYESFYAELVKEHRIRELSAHLLRGGSRTMVGVTWRAIRARTLDRVHPRIDVPRMPPWLGPVLQSELSSRIPDASVAKSGRANSRQWRLDTLEEAWDTYVFEETDRAVSEGHLSLTHPFYDSRVVQFVFDIPEAQRWRGSDKRWLQRRALQRSGLPMIAQRRSEAEFGATFRAQLAELPISRILGESRAAPLGWIADTATSQMEHALRARNPSTQSMAWVWCALALEAWMRAVWG